MRSGFGVHRRVIRQEKRSWTLVQLQIHQSYRSKKSQSRATRKYAADLPVFLPGVKRAFFSAEQAPSAQVRRPVGTSARQPAPIDMKGTRSLKSAKETMHDGN